MNVEDEIVKLQEELRQLEEEAAKQRDRIFFLHRKIMEISGPVKTKVPVKKETAVNASFENFIGLKVIHLIGIIVLVIGLSIGVKYAIDRQLISEIARIGLAYAAGIALYIISHRLKSKYQLFSSILFSGGMATIYFTTYGAFVYYNMMPFAMAFLLMIALTIFTVYQALVYSRQEIAILGLLGAYAIPFLISKNQENATLFFLYISLINVAIVFLSVKKRWTLVGKLAQNISWLLFIGWAGMARTENFQATALIFMMFFFLLFFFNSASPKILRREPLPTNGIYMLIYNTLSFYIAALLVWANQWRETDVALITLYVSVIAALQAFYCNYFLKEPWARNMLAALSFLLFITFIAFQWEGLTVTFLWLLVAIISFVLGLVKKWKPVRMSSIVLFGITLLKLVVVDSLTFNTVQKVISYISLGIVLLVVSYFYQRYRQYIFNDTVDEN